MRGFSDGRLLAALTLVAWSCAKASDSDLAGGAYDPRASGGKSGSGARAGNVGGFSTGGTTAGGKAGTSAAGGTTATGGSSNGFGGSSNGTGGSNATGGTGASTGGSNATGGTGASTGGATATGGTGGAPDLSNTEVVIDYIDQQPASPGAIQLRLFVENKGSTPLDMRAVTVRYWFTPETSTFALKSYFQGADLSNEVTLTFTSGAESYIEAKFSGGTIPPGEPLYLTEFQIKADANFDQTNDWSFSAVPMADPAQPNDKITAYVGSKLVWGCEPSGQCPSANGEGGAAGQGGEAGQAGEPGQGGQPEQGGTSGTTGVSGGAGTAATGGIAGMAGTAGMPGTTGGAGIGGTAGGDGTAGAGGTAGNSGTAGSGVAAGNGGTAGIGVVTAGQGASGSAGT